MVCLHPGYRTIDAPWYGYGTAMVWLWHGYGTAIEAQVFADMQSAPPQELDENYGLPVGGRPDM